jgi:proline iminopeptidase
MAHHEAAGNIDSKEYETAAAEFYRRHLCRLSPWPEAMQRSFAGMSQVVYHTMWGPEEFLATGNLAEYDRTPRLGEIRVPTLLTCGRYDEATPATTAWYASLMPGAELAVFEQSAHMPHLEEPQGFQRTVRGFLRRVEGGQA